MTVHLILFGALLWLGYLPAEAMTSGAQAPTAAVTAPAISMPSDTRNFSALPPAEETRTSTAEAEPTTYTIKAGDTLSHIAKAHGASLQSIRIANALKTDRLRIGQELKIPKTKP